MLTVNSDLFENIQNIFGYNAPEKILIKATYNIDKDENLIKRILQFYNWQKSDILITLVCIGKDDNNFKRIFNGENFIHKIAISVEKNSEHFYPVKEIKNSLITELKKYQMYKRHRISAWIIFVVIAFCAWRLKIRVTTDFISLLVTIFSIIFGFYITGLSILFGSNFSKRLGHEEDPYIKTQTKLYTLKKYFDCSAMLSLFSIVLLLTIILIGFTVDSKQKIIADHTYLFGFLIHCQTISTPIVLGIASVNIMFTSLLFRIFMNAFMEEGSS